MTSFGPEQSTNFNGDSIYLKTADYKLYVGTGSESYYNSATESIGVLCETKVNSLTSSQISISLKKKDTAYTLSK